MYSTLDEMVSNTPPQQQSTLTEMVYTTTPPPQIYGRLNLVDSNCMYRPSLALHFDTN